MKKKYEHLCKDYLQQEINKCNELITEISKDTKLECEIIFKMLDDCTKFKERKKR